MKGHFDNRQGYDKTGMFDSMKLGLQDSFVLVREWAETLVVSFQG